MHVAFATLYDPRDIRRGSGTFFHMSKEMERQRHYVHYIGPVDLADPLISRLLRLYHRKVGKRFKTHLDPFASRLRGRKVARELMDSDYDVFITNDVGLAAYTPVEKPIVLYTDVMLPVDYPNNVPPNSRSANLSHLGVKLFQRTIRRALKRAALSVFPAPWAAEQAKGYDVDPAKIVVIPFGANVEDPGPGVAENRRFANIVSKGRVDLLFVGKDWVRKGGDVAVRTVSELRRRAIEARLHIVGAVPPNATEVESIKTYGLLDKATQTGRARLDGLYQTCDAFILPSCSEGFVIVILEAAAYGLPSLAYNVDGVATAVNDGVTGHLMEPDESEQSFADAIEHWYKDPSDYDRLVVGARRYYEEMANWKKSIFRLFQEIENRI